MDLIERFVPLKKDFSSYDDFYKNFKLDIPADFNFAYDVVDFYAQNEPDKTALVWCNDEGEEKRFTFKQIAQESERAAAFLYSLGVRQNDVVMLSLHRRYEFYFFLLALHRMQAIALPVSSQLVRSELEYRIKESCPRVIVAAPYEDSVTQIEMAAGSLKDISLVAVNFTGEVWHTYDENTKVPIVNFTKTPDFKAADTPMLLYFTSGTEGEPKIVAHDYRYPLSHIITAKYWQRVVPQGLHYTVAETGWAKAGWGKLYGQWICGSAVFMYDRHGFNPDNILHKIAACKVTSFCAPPTIYRYLVMQDFTPYDLSSLKACSAAGEPLSSLVVKAFYEKTGLVIYEGYGQTETALLTGAFPFEGSLPEENCMGRASPLYELSLEDDEIVINLKNGRPAGLFTGYYKNPELTQKVFKDGKYHTGDLAKMDSLGYLHFTGRKDDMIKASGFRISPHEVEVVIEKNPAVEECMVYGEPDEKRGQTVCAAVVLKKGFTHSVELERQLIDFTRQNTALYNCPRKITFVKELSKTYNGKIKRGGFKK